jgi:hypothetical protein
MFLEMDVKILQTSSIFTDTLSSNFKILNSIPLEDIDKSFMMLDFFQ